MDLSLRKQGSICIMIVLSNIGFCVLSSVLSTFLTFYKWLKLRKLKKFSTVMPFSKEITSENENPIGKLNEKKGLV